MTMLNIVIPMAGLGSRFADVGYDTPKPLIPINGKPMIHWVVENLTPAQPHNFIFIVQADHLTAYPKTQSILETIAPGCEIVSIQGVTDGAACTVLKAQEFINNSNPLMIANSDQLINFSVDAYLEAFNSDGLVMTFTDDSPKWSYCRINTDGTINEVVEKKVVSNEATVGVYNFKQGSDFVQAAQSMIKKDLRVNGEFYVAPVYNELISSGYKVFPVNVGKENMHGLGTPEDLERFLGTDICKALGK